MPQNPHLTAPLDDYQKICKEYHSSFQYEPHVTYCSPVFDSYLCWGPTPAGVMASQFCPPARFSDTTRFAFRMCEENGMWQGRRKNESGNIGWTNYTPCFPPEVIELLEKVKDNTQAMLYIAQITRYIEIVGFTFSFFTLSGSLKVLISNRSLRNTRTKIHINLFVAMLLQIIVRLILYIDQEIVRIYFGGGTTGTGIVNTPILCEVSYTFLEYAITEMFIWMFIEGWYLNSVVTSDVLKSEMAFTVVCSISWVGPFLLTLMWAAATFIHYAKEGAATCWYGYNFLDIYWIVQGPRLAIIIINLTFMLNILRVLVTRMHRDIHNDATRVKKGVRAMFLLLPLLGITNVLNMTEAPLDGPTWYFATWSYVTHFFRSFQGTIIAVLYCFLNSEVQAVYIKKFNDWRALRETRRRQGDLRRNGRHPNLISALTQ
ncbi:PDF receptor-like [Ostrinia nubilalis]|uniref:PDF receptor-like n=1 Tax=Ostrinia nubilalis TaxID=29057 RepID=UPI0030824C96